MEEQKRFLFEMAKLELDLARLMIMGPMQAQRWKFTDPALPWPITAELWQRDDGELIFEASIKAPIEQAAVAAGGFLAHLNEIGAERDHSQQAKTRWALEHYAGKVGGRKAAVPAAKKATPKAFAKKAPGRKIGAKKAGPAAKPVGKARAVKRRRAKTKA
jgi:hypothetical protein